MNFVKFLRTPFFKEHLWATASVVRFNINKNVILTYILTCVNLHNPAFRSFNLSMFNEEDGTSLNNKGRKKILRKSQRFQKAFLKTAAQAFETGDFLQVFIRFWGF